MKNVKIQNAHILDHNPHLSATGAILKQSATECSQGHTDANKAFRDCTSKPDGDERIIVRCKLQWSSVCQDNDILPILGDIPRVLESVTMYIHSHFPKEKFSSSDLVDLGDPSWSF